jgi:hypothetical protein
LKKDLGREGWEQAGSLEEVEVLSPAPFISGCWRNDDTRAVLGQIPTPSLTL